MASQQGFLDPSLYAAWKGGEEKEKKREEGVQERQRQDRTRESTTELQHTAHPSVEQVSGQV